MNKIQFETLRYAYELGTVHSEDIARSLYKSEDIIKEAVEYLRSEEYISGEKITAKGIDEVELHKVDNALILAAGMSTRFVPLNYETPKGLLTVKGEKLIERQIEQLHEKGITEIIIVVGYMKEQFEYLIEKYGVTLVETSEFTERNNHASVYAARNWLKNTIVTSSDLYFSENIFQKYAYDSYYCTQYIPGKTAERGIITDENDYILETFYGDRCYDVWATIGYAFFFETFF